MTRAPPGGGNMVSLDELTELLAGTEGITPEETERGAADLDTAPPWEGTLVAGRGSSEPTPGSSPGASCFNDALCIHSLSLRCERRERSLHRR